MTNYTLNNRQGYTSTIASIFATLGACDGSSPTSGPYLHSYTVTTIIRFVFQTLGNWHFSSSILINLIVVLVK